MKLKILAAVLAMAFVGSAFGAELETTVQGQSPSEAQLKWESRRTMRGYKAMIDANYFLLSNNDANFIPNDCLWFCIWGRGYVSTTHGYQFNNYIFLGGGLEFGGYDLNAFTKPIYADLKLNFTNTKVSPFLESKVGSFVGRFYGFYWSETAGIRIGLNKRSAINLGVEFSFHHSWKPGYVGSFYGLGTRIGYEF